MADRTGLSRSTIGRIWKTFGLKPHLTDGFKLSNDPLFVEKVYDIVGLYLDPPESAVVLSVDEKSQVQAPRTVAAGVPDDARDAREAHARLLPARHHEPVHRDERGRRHRDHLHAPPAPSGGVQEVPAQDRPASPRVLLLSPGRP